MNYNKTVYTSPMVFAAGQDHEIEAPLGDTYFITLTEWQNRPLNLLPARPAIERDKVIRNTLFIRDTNSHIADIVTEGEDLNVVVALTEAYGIDISFDWTITHGGDFINGEANWEKDESNYNYQQLHRDTVDADYNATLTGQATIAAGDTTVTITIPTVDDAVFTGGENSYKVSTITLSNYSVGTGDILPDESRTSSLIIMSDSSPRPIIEGVVSLWVRMGEDTEMERLGGRSDAVSFSLGQDTNGDSLLETCIFDDTPIEKLIFRVAEDPTAPNGEDITQTTLRFNAQIKSGRRNLN